MLIHWHMLTKCILQARQCFRLQRYVSEQEKDDSCFPKIYILFMVGRDINTQRETHTHTDTHTNKSIDNSMKELNPSGMIDWRGLGQGECRGKPHSGVMRWCLREGHPRKLKCQVQRAWEEHKHGLSKAQTEGLWRWSFMREGQKGFRTYARSIDFEYWMPCKETRLKKIKFLEGFMQENIFYISHGLYSMAFK